jgi:DNA helicase-4
MSVILTQRRQSSEIEMKLSEFKFNEADEIFYELIKWSNYSQESLDGYEELRRTYVEEFFSKKIPLPHNFDQEQLSAISSIYKNTLVSARAGSWKTKVIAGKIAFSILWEWVSPEEILTLSFNKKAALEIWERLIQEKEGFNIKDYNFSQTFHALCYSIVKPKSQILIDIEKFEDPKTGITIEYNVRKQQKFIQKCFLSEFNTIRKYLENELSDEYAHLKRDGIHLEDDEFYNQRISKPYAFTWDYVRSKWERYLLDFLVEYWFSEIKYEPIVNINWKIKKPDILCKYKWVKKPIYIEHWGSDSDWSLKVPEHWGIDGKEKYDKNKQEKQQYFHAKESAWELIFIETTINDIQYWAGERELFFAFLKKLFELRLWVELKRKSRSEIIEEIRLNNHFIYPIVKRIQQYIQKAQFQRKTPEKMRQAIIDFYEKENIDEETKAFLIVSNIIYRKYEGEKKKLNAIDFNTLIELAIEKINENKWNILIQINDWVMNLNNLKYILIDEYQDFSPLFYWIIRIIKQYNPNFKLFVVWDDWQAINSFAWSDIHYFLEFYTHFEWEQTTIRNISTNYRSTKNIVQSWNILMEQVGWKESIPFSNEIGNKIKLIEVNKSSIYGFDNEIINKIFPIEEKDKKKAANIKLKRKVFTEILNIIDSSIREWWSILVLARNNVVYSENLGDWKLKVEEYYRQLVYKQKLTNNEKQEKLKKLWNIFLNWKIEFLTCHKSKWKQADSVIILDASKKNFPINEDEMRDNKNYFKIFDDTPENMLINERKLFYVALTRAKKQQYIFYETWKETAFIKELSRLI